MALLIFAAMLILFPITLFELICMGMFAGFLIVPIIFLIALYAWPAATAAWTVLGIVVAVWWYRHHRKHHCIGPKENGT